MIILQIGRQFSLINKLCFEIFIISLVLEENAGDFSRFCCCWSLVGDKLEMLESATECTRLGDYGFNRVRYNEIILRVAIISGNSGKIGEFYVQSGKIRGKRKTFWKIRESQGSYRVTIVSFRGATCSILSRTSNWVWQSPSFPPLLSSHFEALFRFLWKQKFEMPKKGQGSPIPHISEWPTNPGNPGRPWKSLDFVCP